MLLYKNQVQIHAYSTNQKCLGQLHLSEIGIHRPVSLAYGGQKKIDFIKMKIIAIFVWNTARKNIRIKPAL